MQSWKYTEDSDPRAWVGGTYVNLDVAESAIAEVQDIADRNWKLACDIRDERDKARKQGAEEERAAIEALIKAYGTCERWENVEGLRCRLLETIKERGAEPVCTCAFPEICTNHSPTCPCYKAKPFCNVCGGEHDASKCVYRVMEMEPRCTCTTDYRPFPHHPDCPCYKPPEPMEQGCDCGRHVDENGDQIHYYPCPYASKPPESKPLEKLEAGVYTEAYVTNAINALIDHVNRIEARGRG